MRVRRILGQKGRITIPYDIRKKCKFSDGDVLLFQNIARNCVLVSKLPVENSLVYDKSKPDRIKEFLDSLTVEEIKRVVIYLCDRKNTNTRRFK